MENESGAHGDAATEQIVAAVYDRRTKNEPGAHRDAATGQIVAAVCDRRMENESGAHGDAATEQIVAAVCDRRMENELGAHRDAATGQIVAAVCDRRMENEPGAHRDAATGQPPQKSRLRRLDRVFVESPVFFLTACTLDRRPILDCESVHNAFRTFCLNSPQHGAWIGRYVLMPDHLHLFVSFDEIPLSKWVKSLKNALSKMLRTVGQEGPHWQKGFFDHLLRSCESYSQKWDYVRENPVRAGLVESALDWPYAGEIHDLEYRK